MIMKCTQATTNIGFAFPLDNQLTGIQILGELEQVQMMCQEWRFRSVSVVA